MAQAGAQGKGRIQKFLVGANFPKKNPVSNFLSGWAVSDSDYGFGSPVLHVPGSAIEYQFYKKPSKRFEDKAKTFFVVLVAIS